MINFKLTTTKMLSKEEIKQEESESREESILCLREATDYLMILNEHTKEVTKNDAKDISMLISSQGYELVTNFFSSVTFLQTYLKDIEKRRKERIKKL